LVRPNQGLIRAGGSEVVQILLVEKDKNQLLASYNSLGAAALDHCKDKFLVQSVAVSPEQAANLQEYDQLTALWASNPVAVANKKLHVRHRVGGSEEDYAADGTPRSAASPVHTSSSTSNAVNPQDMSKEQLITELTALRRKYDELVAFSVNLTAERDMLSNMLEQTKRDLNREIAKSGKGGASAQPTVTAKGKRGYSAFAVIFLCLLAILLGAKLQEAGFVQKAVHVVFGGSGGGGTQDDGSGFQAEL
jgi:hypothetical protein